MPFLDDSGVRDSGSRGPLAESFALFAGNVERMLVVNLAWAAQIVPGLAAVAFGNLPGPLRVLMLTWTVVFLPPATAALFAVARLVADGGYLGVEAAVDAVRGFAVPGWLSLGPLYAGTGALMWVASLSLPVPVRVLAGWGVLASLLIGTFWGPLLAQYPGYGPARLLRESLRRTFAQPLRTALTALVWLLLAGLGAISVGGLFLAVPAVIALIQTTWLIHTEPIPTEPARGEVR